MKKQRKRERKEREKKERENKEVEKKEVDQSCEIKCPVSHPTLPHTLFIRAGGSIQSGCFACGEQKQFLRDPFHYHCTTCDVDYHQGCHLRSKQITHPYHLQHPLTFTRLDENPQNNNVVHTRSRINFDLCGWCVKNPDTWVYSCSICSFRLCLPCSEKIPLLTIHNPKNHHHPLYFLPRPLLVTCDACGLVRAWETSYTCFQCNYMVHESCMDLPRIIKLTRHPHRLFLAPYLPREVLSCLVCYKAVDTRYGQYSCHDDDCSYVLHSKCATHDTVWDGRELEWEDPEDQNEPEDVASFKKVGHDLIDYFDHEHHLRLDKYDGARDATKQCQACVFPINNVNRFYDCNQCSYSLHEECASLPRKLDHVLHKHSLVLDTSPLDDYDAMTCAACTRNSNGFRYKCLDKACVIREFHIEIRCTLIPHLFTHKSHEQHPLYNFVSYGAEAMERCPICKEKVGYFRLHCTECEFVMCYRCATIPTEIHYKHDEHPLTLCYGGEGRVVDHDGIYWCEVCERKIDPEKWFYTCDKCCTTVHRLCIFGSSYYMKVGSTFDRHGFQVKTIPNNSSTRLICAICEDRCTYSVCYTLLDEYEWLDKALCSFWCMHIAMRRISPQGDEW